MNYDLALKLKLAKFPQSLSKEAEYYIAPNVILRRKDIFTDTFHDSPKEASTTNEFVYKPRAEDLMEINWEQLVNNWLKLNE